MPDPNHKSQHKNGSSIQLPISSNFVRIKI